MNEGVQILIERMKTHPEEFVPEYDGGVTKWGNAIGQYRTYLTAEDNKALDDAWKETVVIAMRERFTTRVMEELLDPKEEEQLTLNPYATKRPPATLSATTTLGAYSNTAVGTVTLPSGSITLGNTTLQESQLQRLLQLQVDEARNRVEEDKKKQTLFGRLFNYQ